MVYKCAHCNSGNTEQLFDKFCCLDCAGVTGHDGLGYTGEGNTEVVGA